MEYKEGAGSAAAILVKFSLPLILSGVLQQLYSWADAFIVGHLVGEDALAAVGAAAAVSELFILAITGFTLGLSILAAQKHGQGQSALLSRILSTFLALLLPVFLLLSGLGAASVGEILHLMDTPANMLPFAGDYLRVIFIGLPFLAIYNTYSALLRAMGNSKAPFYAVLLSSCTNVVLDLLFIALFRWGVAGAAWATVLSQAAMTAFIALYAMKTYPLLRFSPRGKWVDWGVFRMGCRFGIPPMIQSSVTAMGNMVLQNFMNGFGSQTVAAITTAYRVDSIMLLPIVNLGSAISTKVAQNEGAGARARARKFFAAGLALNAAVAGALTLFMLLFGGNLVEMFGVGPEAAAIGRTFFRSIALYYVFYGLASAMRGAMEGMGGILYSSAVGISALCVRIALSYLLAQALGNMAVASAEGLQWVFMVLLQLPYFLFESKRRKKRAQALG